MAEISRLVVDIGRISVPPLRERAADIELLANHFLESCNKEYNRDIEGIRPAAMELMRKYPWPGNVRQLKNTIERAVLIESEKWIEVKDLNLEFELDQIKVTGDLQGKTLESRKDISEFRFPTQGIALEELERGIINSALEKAQGNLSHAARLLKITRGKLRYRLEKLGIDV